ncbi:MAG: GNAT family N-acetyltransferase [Candidatus Omnitrophica bacterium]|nr:GNAT family N-acetyltransferase [Candidatus Omnitrophota bacterium]
MALRASFIKVADNTGINNVECLAREIWPEHFLPIIGPEQVQYMLAQFQSAGAIKKQIEDGALYFLVVFEKNNIGYLSVVPEGKGASLFLSKLYLLARYRGQGFGREMLGFVEDMARSMNLKALSLNVNKRNAATIDFYVRMGFVKAASDMKDLGGGFWADDWLMEKLLLEKKL